MFKLRKDERENEMMHNLNSIGLYLVITISSIYVLAHTLIIKDNISNYAFALYLLVGLFAYLMISPIIVGIAIDTRISNKQILLIGSITGILVGIFSILNSYLSCTDFYTPKNYYTLFVLFGISVVSAFVITMSILSVFKFITNLRKKQIDNKLDNQQ